MSRGRSQDELLAGEIANVLLTNSLEYVRGTNQALQTLTSLLLTAYLAAVGAFADDQLADVSVILLALPAGLFTLSLVLLFGRAALYRGSEITFGDLAGTVAAYEEALAQRRSQLLLPSAVTLLGLISLAAVTVAAAD